MHHQRSSPFVGARSGMTLAELLIVVSVLAIMSVLIVPVVSQQSEQSRDALARDTLTRSSLAHLQAVIGDTYFDDLGELPYPQPSMRMRVSHPQLVYLYVNGAGNTQLAFDPIAKRGWRGPYIRSGIQGRYVVDVQRGFTTQYGENGDSSPVDGWGHPIVLQQPVLQGGVASRRNRQAARLVSAGPNGVLDTPASTLQPTLDQQHDDIVIYLRGAP